MSVFEISNIKKSYGKRVILDDVTFSAEQGDCIGIVGANGCGKSTLLGIISGCKKADSGKVVGYGNDLTANRSLFSKFVGFVPQENPLMDKLSVLDNLKFWYCDSKRSLDEDLKTGVPAIFGLSSYLNYSVDKLSGGMRKRLSIACSLAKDPPILILDEPGASLDLICKDDIKRYLTSYMANGGTVIITSHEDSELALCTKMFLLQDSKLTELKDLPTGSSLRERMRASYG